MAIIKAVRLPNANDRSVILQRVNQEAAGDVCYILYPSAGVSRYGAGDAVLQVYKGGATSVVVGLSLCGLDEINAYLADRDLLVPTGIQEPKFVTVDTHTADAIKQYMVPFTVMKLTFTGLVGTDKAFAILGVA